MVLFRPLLSLKFSELSSVFFFKFLFIYSERERKRTTETDTASPMGLDAMIHPSLSQAQLLDTRVCRVLMEVLCTLWTGTVWVSLAGRCVLPPHHCPAPLRVLFATQFSILS